MARIACVLLGAFLLCSLAAAQEEAGEKALSDQEIEALVKALGSDSWKERTEAEKKLAGAGWQAGPALEKATKSNDPEISERASRILDKISYLADKVKAEVDALYEKLKSRDENKRDRAFDKLVRKGSRVISYLGKLLTAPSDNKVEIALAVERSWVTKQNTVPFTVTLRNAGEKPVWVSEPARKVWGSYRQFGKTSANVSWSRGSSGFSDCFPFVYLAPGETLERKGTFTPYSGRVGAHEMALMRTTDKRIELTEISDEKQYLPIAHCVPEKPLGATVLLVPEIVEGESGKPGSGFSVSLKVSEEAEEGGELSLKLAIKNVSQAKRTIEPGKFDYSWCLLVPTSLKEPGATDGILELPAEAKEAKTLEAGEALEFSHALKAGLKAGEYYVICGFSRQPQSQPEAGDFYGEIVSNAAKVRVTPPKEK